MLPKLSALLLAPENQEPSTRKTTPAGCTEYPPKLVGSAPTAPSPNIILPMPGPFGPIFPPSHLENQPEQPPPATHPRSPFGKRSAEPCCQLTNSPCCSHYPHSWQPAKPAQLLTWCLASKFPLLLSSPLSQRPPPRLVIPSSNPSPPKKNFGSTQPAVIFQANCSRNQLSLFPWGYFNLYKSIISYHDQPLIHLLLKY